MNRISLPISAKITGGCAVLELIIAFVVGSIAGILYILGSELLVRIKIDDAVDAIPVHAIGGLWGLLAVGFCASPSRMGQVYGEAAAQHPGFFYTFPSGSHFDLLGCQVVGILFILGWTLVTMLPFFLWLNFMGWFRSGSVQELVGLDIAYNLDGGEGVMAMAGGLDPGYEEDVRPEYMDAYQRYRDAMREKRQAPSAAAAAAAPS
jgi:ammonia channel protein AmtB